MTAQSLQPVGLIERAEAELLSKPQVECPVVHHFGPGIYMREVTIPAGSIAIGHKHRHPHMNIMLRGRMALISEDGSFVELSAPMSLVSGPGRKVAYVHEDVVWLNVYATDETDVERLEELLFEKSESYLDYERTKAKADNLMAVADREDFAAMLDDIGMTADHVSAISSDESDLVDLPPGGYKIKVSESPIDGRGLFATAAIEAGEVIAIGRVNGRRTIAGRYTNHSARPNARMLVLPNGDIALVAARHISGCHGGNDGEEITVDYRQAVAASQEASKCLA